MKARHAIVCLAIRWRVRRRASALNPALDIAQYAHTAWKFARASPKRVIGDRADS